MAYLKRWNWIWLLSCALFWLMPNKVGAQITQDEKVCAARVAKDTILHHETFRMTLDETIRNFKEGDYCQRSIAALTPPKGYAQYLLVTPLLKAMMPNLTACFFPDPSRMADGRVATDLLNILTESVTEVLPQPLCTSEQLQPSNNEEDLI